MKNTLLLLSLIMFFSCSHPENSLLPVLSRADSLLQIGYADSALILLGYFPVDDLTTVSLQARHALLLTQAMDKNYITLTGDSLIRIAVKYYDSTNDLSSRAKAHYYWGRVHQDMGDVEGTVREFLTAMPLAKKAKEHTLMCLLQGNLGYLCWEHGLLDEADSLYKEEARLAEEQQDSIHWAISLTKRGDIHIEKGEGHYVEAETYLKQALLIAVNIHCDYIEKGVVTSLAALYERTDRMPEALFWGQRGITLEPDTTQHYGLYLLLGSVYSQIGRNDSAYIYLNKCLTHSDPYVREGVYLRLSELAEKEGKLDEAYHYEHNYTSYKDSARLRENPVKVISSIKEILRQQSIEQYESSVYRYQHYLFLSIAFIFGFIVFHIINVHRKETSFFHEYQTVSTELKRTKEALRKMEGEIKDQKERHSINECQIGYCVTALLEEKDKKQVEMKADMEAKIKDLENQYDHLIANLSKKNFRNLIEETDIYKKICHIKEENRYNVGIPQRLDDEDWEKLKEEINQLIPGFTTSLKSQFIKLKDDDILFLCLIKIGFKYSEMQYIFSCTVNALYKREESVKNRMQLERKANLKELINHF